MHFTYASPDGDLKQGDLIRRTAQLEEILQEAHPYYRKDAYTHFLVITQTCDLVRRGADEFCAAPYVTLCAVRSLSGVIDREADKYRTSDLLRAAKANSRNSRDRLLMFLKRLLNNNNHEYFYLHDDATLGITDRLCGYLRLSVAVKAVGSYDAVASARIASLEPTFQAKLGWLVANIYGRVGTDDWAPDHYSEDEWNSTVETILDESVTWLDDGKVKAAEKALRSGNGAPAEMTKDSVMEFIAQQSGLKRKDLIIDAILEDLRKSEILTEEAAKVSRKILANSATVSALVK